MERDYTGQWERCYLEHEEITLWLELAIWGRNGFVCFVFPPESLETFSAETI